MEVTVSEANFENSLHSEGILTILDSYARDPVGGGSALSEDVQERLLPGLRKHPTCLVLLAFAEGRAVGIAVCFFGYSTFAAAPLLNIHDLAVLPELRGRGIGRALLLEAEGRAVSRGCCKLTLEVQDDNTRARGLYDDFGFGDFVLGDSLPTRFLSKTLVS